MKRTKICKQKQSKEIILHNQQQPNKIKQGHTNRIKEKQRIIIITNTPKTIKDMQTKANKKQRLTVIQSNQKLTPT